MDHSVFCSASGVTPSGIENQHKRGKCNLARRIQQLPSRHLNNNSPFRDCREIVRTLKPFQKYDQLYTIKETIFLIFIYQDLKKQDYMLSVSSVKPFRDKTPRTEHNINFHQDTDIKLKTLKRELSRKHQRAVGYREYSKHLQNIRRTMQFYCTDLPVCLTLKAPAQNVA